MEGDSHGKKLCQWKNIFRKTVGTLIMISTTCVCSTAFHLQFLFRTFSFIIFVVFISFILFLTLSIIDAYNMFYFRYNESLELEDAIHTAILTLKVNYFEKFVNIMYIHFVRQCNKNTLFQ